MVLRRSQLQSMDSHIQSTKKRDGLLRKWFRRIAEHVASAVPPGRSILLDAFCGAGGNTIAFALSGRWKRVYAIEKDPATLACAMQNARIYGVADQITWFEGDCFELLGLKKTEPSKEVSVLKTVLEQFGVLFASPPWGGESTDGRSPPILRRSY